MQRYLLVLLLLIGLTGLRLHGAPADDIAKLEQAIQADPPPPVSPTSRALENLPENTALSCGPWQLRRYLLKEVTTPLQKRLAPKQEKAVQPVHLLPVDFSDNRDFFARPQGSLWGWNTLHVELEFPEGFPDEADLYFFVKDWDDLWLHIRKPVTSSAGQRLVFALPISGKAATQAWTPRGHQRPWHQLTPDQLSEVGIKIAAPAGIASTWKGDVKLHGLTLSRSLESTQKPRIHDLQRLPEVPQVGRMVEISFRVNHLYKDPFNPADVDLAATITTPNGDTYRTRAFYMEDFLYDDKPRGSRLLTPHGMPRFAVRFTPRHQGFHKVAIAGHLGSVALALPELEVEILPETQPWKGFVRVSPHDDRLLVNSRDNSEYWGLGMNMRSPNDTRYHESFPFTEWDGRDFEVYEKLLPKYAAAGIKVIEVWMSPWWLALEWIPDAPGNHGLGYMNPWRAWKIDRLMMLAEKYDLQVILVINNHGKFSAWIDSDWARNPFNKENGGPLVTPMEYFSKPVAREAFKRLADYMVARWGYSSNLLAWKLFTEIDLTGDNRQWYKDQSVTDWHRFAARYLKSIDPNQHLVTTHWATSYELVNEELAKLPELDILTLDIYYGGSGARHLFNFMFSTASFVDSMKKPAIITEFGGSPHGDTLPHILHQLHMGLWAGYFTKFPVSPCFWWYPLVEEKNLYSYYESLAHFAAGENRTGAKRVNRTLRDDLYLCELRQENSRLFWLLDTKHYFGGSLTIPPTVHRTVDLEMPGLPAGTYEVEFWDCRSGIRMQQERWQIQPGDSSPKLKLPVFQCDIAGKIRRVQDAAKETAAD